MKIVIDIPKKTYNEIKERTIVTCGETFAKKLVVYIRKGTPLPAKHGRLIDGDKVLDEIEKQYPASVSETDKRKRYARLVYYWAVKNAPTIIEGGESK